VSSRGQGRHRAAPPTKRRRHAGTHRHEAATTVRWRYVAALPVAAVAAGWGVVVAMPGTPAEETAPVSEPTIKPPEPTSIVTPRAVIALDRRTLVPSDTPRAEVRPKPKPQPPELPEVGSGEFAVAPGTTSVVGAGALTTYTVEVEREVPLPLKQVAGLVDQVLGDPRSWTADGSHSLQRVEADGDVRVLVATPATTDELCAPLDTAGRLSCRNGDLVVLNAWRWLDGAEAYGKNLTDYRRYLINHEFGHALGNPHEDCSQDGAAAPVMMQQTKGVAPCQPNPWPYPG
jgi:hypothetical protein